jgi:hypothetical protein
MPSPRRPSRIAALALLALLSASAGRAAEELPPNRPRVPYQGVFAVAFKGEIAPREQHEFEDQVTIAVSGRRLLQESRAGNPRMTLMDLAKGEVLEFDPEDPDKVVERVAPEDVPPVVFVDGSSVFEEFGAPEAVGNEQVAGQPCTLLRFGDPEKEGAEACVTPDGIVARARLRLPGFERSWTAESLTKGPVADSRFALPEGFAAPGSSEAKASAPQAD